MLICFATTESFEQLRATLPPLGRRIPVQSRPFSMLKLFLAKRISCTRAIRGATSPVLEVDPEERASSINLDSHSHGDLIDNSSGIPICQADAPMAG